MFLFRYHVCFIIMAVIVVAFSAVVPSLATQTETLVIPSSVEEQLEEYVKQYIDWYDAKYCTDRDPNDTGTCRGGEYREARRFCFGDIDGDGEEDIAVLYTLGGLCCGNNYHFYLAVFLKRVESFELVTSEKVGGKGERGVDFNAIKGAKILLETREYLLDDSMSYPSGKGSTTYELEDGKLIESDRVGEEPMSLLERYRRSSEHPDTLID